jgi:hypothetical protein
MATNGDGVLDPSWAGCLFLLGMGRLFIFLWVGLVEVVLGRGRFFIDAKMGKHLVLCNVGERKRSATSPYVSS